MGRDIEVRSMPAGWQVIVIVLGGKRVDVDGHGGVAAV
jgi:hypothetical protein